MKHLLSAIALVAAGAGINQSTQVQLYANGGLVSSANPLPMSVSSSSGTSWSRDISLANGLAPVAAHVTKSGATILAGLEAYNYSGNQRYLQLFNQSSTPTNGQTPIDEYPIGFGIASSPTAMPPLGAGFFGPGGLPGTYSAGLAWCVSSTSGICTLAAATDVTVKVLFK